MSLDLGDIQPSANIFCLVTIENRDYTKQYLEQFELVYDQLYEDGPAVAVGHNWSTTPNRRRAGLFEPNQLTEIIFDMACHGFKVSIELVSTHDR